jgi:hypothetical protein
MNQTTRPAVNTASEALRREVEERRERAHVQLRTALEKVLATPEGRRLWIWIRDEKCFAGKRAPFSHNDMLRFEGRRDVGLDLDKAVEDFFDVRMALAKERAVLEAEQVAYDAALERLKVLEPKKE